MNILLDTQAFLWLITDSPRVTNKAKKVYLDQNNDFYLSMVSVWEIAIKKSIKKLTLKQPLVKFIPTQLQMNNIQPLDVKFKHLTELSNMPFHHRDPFDRLLISQALTEKFHVLSSDAAFDEYRVNRLW